MLFLALRIRLSALQGGIVKIGSIGRQHSAIPQRVSVGYPPMWNRVAFCKLRSMPAIFPERDVLGEGALRV
jgi:hypothetical protein